jgi:hypothetical protein
MENQDETTLKKLLERAMKARQKRLSKLKSLAVVSERNAKAYVRAYFRCHDVRIAGTYDAWRRIAQPKKGDPVPYTMIFEAAKALDMWKSSSEPVLLRPKERLNGRRRYIPIRRIIEIARDRIAFEAAKPLTKFHPNQFGQKGLNQLHEWLQATLPKGQIVITTDIPSCYDTIKRSSVMRDMPLPKHVMKAVLIDTKERAVHLVEEPKGSPPASLSCSGEASPTFVDAGPSCRGILTGSALAALASDSVIRHVLVSAEEAAPGVHAAAWGDNLMFIIEEAKDAARVFAAVEKAVADNFGFDVVDGLARRKQETALPSRFFFCGRWYKWSGGKLICKTDTSRVEAAMLRLATLVSDAKTEEDFIKIERVMTGYAIANRHTPSIIAKYMHEAMKIGEKRVSLLGQELLKEIDHPAEPI